MRVIPAISLAIFLGTLAVAAQEQKKADDAIDRVPVEQWLAGPDRKDFKWDVQLLPAHLTFQQRYIVQVRAAVDVASLRAADKRDLYFVLKVADESGKWLPDDTHNHYVVPPDIDKSNDIEFTAGFYAKPGHYTAALILYDAEHKQGNVWRKAFEVKPPKNDPLPSLDEKLAPVEFVDEVPEDALPVHNTPGYVRSRRGPPVLLGAPPAVRGDEQWRPGHGMELLPVRNSRPLRVDVILNVAPWLDPYLMRGPAAASYRTDAGRIAQIGALLSHISVPNGCVRVSAIDLSKLQVVFDPTDGKDADWDKLTDKIRKHDHDTIDVNVLSNRKSTAGFLRDYMTNLMEDRSACGGENAERAIILVSHDFSFPNGTHGDRLWPDTQCACRFYHLHITGASGGDDLEKFLKPANPRRLDAGSPEEFRKVVAELIGDLGSAPGHGHEAAK